MEALDIDTLLRRTLAGEREAWRELQAALEPTVLAIAKRHPDLRSRGLANAPDDLREITVTSFERLARDDFRNLRRFQERSTLSAKPGNDFDAWVYGAVEFVIREHLRRRFGRAPKAPASEAQRPRPSKRDLQSHAGRIDVETEGKRSLVETVGMTTRMTAAQIFAYIDGSFAPDEARALRLYYHGDLSFAEIARELGLDDESSAARLVRRLNARLRYHFTNEAESP